ncbi:MAG: Deoxyhypusine synthase-like protein [Planctomycetes bacterium]|nr:Deoxyhypusine synthase-like protein [Planctomycetota bacterium]
MKKSPKTQRTSPLLGGRKILPRPVAAGVTVKDLIDNAFCAYNGARLREGARLLSEKMLAADSVVGLSVSGALTPAGLGMSCLIPLVEAGFVDWIIATGANLYHDTHFAIGKDLVAGRPDLDDRRLRDEGVVRIYDVLFDYTVLLDTDLFFRKTIEAPEFQRPMSTAEFHHAIGRYVAERERVIGRGRKSFLAACFEHDVPVFTSSPGDSSIGMNVAARGLFGNKLVFDVNADVNQTAAIVLHAKREVGKSAVWILGGGSPKNFMLQTEPQLQEVLFVDERGHDYFLQVTDARPDTGGLSGATPGEAVTWGKVDPDQLPDTVVAYVDSTVALPLLTGYALTARKPRKPRRLFRKLPQLMDVLRAEAERGTRKHEGKTTRLGHR